MRRRVALGAALWLVVVSASASAPVMAAANIKCTLKFTMRGWSAFYKTSSGTGTITCNNGRALKVSLSAKGGGLTVGKSSIEDGYGRFSTINSMDDLYGTYVAAEARAGTVKSSGAQVMSKGEVSLALSGSGPGSELGVALGALTISP